MTLRKRVGSDIVSGPKYEITGDKKKDASIPADIYDPDGFKMSIAVLNGASFTDAGRMINVKRQSAFERFHKTIVRRPFNIVFDENDSDINILRKKWQDYKAE